VEFDEDTGMRLAAFKHVEALCKVHGTLTSEHLSEGFTFEGRRLPLVNPQRGIFKPREMQYLLSIRTVYPKTGRKVWYDDQRRVHQQIFAGDDVIDYAFMGQDPDAADNRWLKEAWERKVAILYFLGVAPGQYQFFPAFIVGWDGAQLEAKVAFAADRFAPALPATTIERRYAPRSVKQRLHQASFREALITAYNRRCALSGLPEPKLLDAAHIVEDPNEDLGQAVVTNGLLLSKIHHAAFDAHLIGIDPDYRLHVSNGLDPTAPAPFPRDSR